jgi:hypothetical protein
MKENVFDMTTRYIGNVCSLLSLDRILEGIIWLLELTRCSMIAPSMHRLPVSHRWILLLSAHKGTQLILIRCCVRPGPRDGQ